MFRSHLGSLSPNRSQTQPIRSLYSILKTFWLLVTSLILTHSICIDSRIPSEHRFLYWDSQPLVFNGIPFLAPLLALTRVPSSSTASSSAASSPPPTPPSSARSPSIKDEFPPALYTATLMPAARAQYLELEGPQCELRPVESRLQVLARRPPVVTQFSGLFV